MSGHRSVKPTAPWHTCWALTTEPDTCFDCGRDMDVDDLDLAAIARLQNPLTDVAPSFDQDAYYDGRTT